MFSRFIIVAPVALAVSALFVGAAAYAAPSADTCTSTPAQLRAAAGSATTDKAKSALILISTGERLCAVDATAEAGKKFAAAARALNVDMASLATAKTASTQ